MGSSANSSTSFRRQLAIGGGVLLTLASLLPLTVSAAGSASTKTAADSSRAIPASSKTIAGAVTNVTGTANDRGRHPTASAADPRGYDATEAVASSIGALITPFFIVGDVLTSVAQRPTGSSASSQRGDSAAAQQPGGAHAVTTPPAPLLILPAPSQSTVLGPVPLPVPVVNSLAAAVGGALPWKWFLLLAILDLGLIVAILLRRRSAQRDRVHQP